MEGRELVRAATAADLQAGRIHPEPPPVGSLYPPYSYDGHAWGMAIDLSACVGCNACIVACQSENNSPVVGREEVLREREMHWLRVDSHARIAAEKQGRRVRDGEILTACQAACPSNAIVFGDINDRDSQVARLKAEPRNYALLRELNTRPRTTYLMALHNPNAGLEVE